ncbi:MAG TPA: EI24 domain-containing protein [Ferruginibacter sp.]|jgi:CysZ protein|nr:EI24 domain-containing protein [Ferruginibacter sp.]
MLKDIIIAIRSYVKAHQFIVDNRLWKWIIIPGILYAALFFASMHFFWITSKGVIEYGLTETGIGSWFMNNKESVWGLLFVIVRVAVQLVFFFFYFSLFKYLFLIVGSPVFVYLNGKTEAIIEGREYPFSFRQFFTDIFRGISIALRNMAWQTVYSLSILILSFIPIIGLATVVLAFFVECYYLGFSMLDYSCERKKMSPSQSAAFISKHQGLAIGNGIVFYMMHLFLIVGWILAPSYAVIASTLSLHDKKGAFLKS